MVARYIAAIIDDGSTLQIELGRVPNEALRYLTDRRDLGIHSDVITDGVVDLACRCRDRSPQNAPSRADRHQLLPWNAAALRFRTRQSTRDIPADRPGLRSRSGRCQSQHGLDNSSLRRGPDRTGLCRPVRRRILWRCLHPSGIHARSCAFDRRQADHLPRLNYGKWCFTYKAASGGRRGRGNCAVGCPLRDHRVRHRLPVREVDPRAGCVADRSGAPELSRGVTHSSKASGLRSRPSSTWPRAPPIRYTRSASSNSRTAKIS